MAALIASSLGLSPAYAVEWDLTPRLSGSARFTDNVNQSGTNPESALILSVTPGFSLVSKGSRRVQATVTYGLSGVARFGGDSSTDINHNLSALGKAELIEDFLFLDGSARISQELISLLGSPADADTNSSNRATVGTYSLSPSMKKRLGTFATAEARLTHSGAIFGSNAASNTAANALTASLNSGTRFNDFGWSVNYSLRQAEYANNGTTRASSSTFENTSATLSYALTRKFRMFGTVGQDSNDFINASQSNGSYYTAGFGWSPTRRTSVEASAGKRFLGNTFALSLLHRSHYSNWNIRYSESVSDTPQRLLTGTVYVWQCQSSNQPEFTSDLSPPVNEVNCTLLSSLPVERTIAEGVFLVKSLTGGVAWSKGKLGAGLNVFDTRRSYLLLATNTEDHARGVNGNVNYRLAPNTRLTSTLGFINNQVPAGFTGTVARDDNIYTVSIGLNHRFDAEVSGTLTLRHQQRDSNVAAASFDENSITATLSKRF